MNDNQLCGMYYDREGDLCGTYTAEAISKIAEMLKVNTTLKSIRCAPPLMTALIIVSTP